MGGYFGIVADANAKGSSFGDLTLGAVPAPVQAWPMTNLTVEPGRQSRQRANENRGGRGTSAPVVSRHAPSIQLQGLLYPELATSLLLMALGSTSRDGGPAPEAFVDSIVPAADSVLFAPGVNIGVERDGLFQQMSGAKLQSLTLTFPEGDEDATFEATFNCLYLTRPTSAPTWPEDWAYLGPKDHPLQLRDAQAFENGSSTSVDCLRAFTIQFEGINRDVDFCAGKDVETRVTAGIKDRIWWPHKQRLAPRRQITGSVEFSGIDGTREAMADVVRAQQLVFEIAARDLTTTPAATELLRFTLFAAAWTGGGPDAWTRDADLNTTMEFGAFVDSSDKDIEVEYVNNKSTGIALPA